MKNRVNKDGRKKIRDIAIVEMESKEMARPFVCLKGGCRTGRTCSGMGWGVGYGGAGRGGWSEARRPPAACLLVCKPL